MEVTTGETTMEVTASKDSENNQNQNTLDCGVISCPQRENQNWETPYTKSTKLDHNIMSFDMPDDSHCSDTMDGENVIDKDALHNGSYQGTPEHNIDMNTTSDDLRQFDVLDDLDRHPEQNDGSDSDSDTDESMDSDVPDEEIEAMLEEGDVSTSSINEIINFYVFEIRLFFIAKKVRLFDFFFLCSIQSCQVFIFLF